MLPGKKYKPEDLLSVFRKRFWWVIVPFALVAAGTAAVARKLPDRYYSEAIVRVVPQQVPDKYVKSPITENIQDRLNAMQQQAMSRTRLERIITDFNLYPEERRKGIMEDVVQQMRGDITINILKGDVFRIGYTGSNPRTVQKVAEAIASFFITESEQDRATLAEGTNQFIEAQLEDARRHLIDQEKRLQDYKTRFSGQLPTQLQANLQAQANAQMQIRAITDSINQDTNRRLILDGQIKDLESGAPGPDNAAGVAALAASGDAVQGGTTLQQLELAKQILAVQQKSKSDAHPDVKAWKKAVADLQAKADAEALVRPVSQEVVPVVPPGEAARLKKIKDARDMIAQIDRQVAASQAEVKRLRTINDDLQARIDAVPGRESELIELMRDYDTLTRTYNDLLAKREDSKLAANLETRQYGEKFKLLDSPRIPEKPTSPNRPMINLGGMAAGLGLGIALVALLEYRDRSFKTDDEVITLLALPVLAVVPIMESNEERRRTRRRKFYLGVGLGSTVVGCLAILIYTFVR
ncbi:MAG TPA: GNVR domain-containing protein [Vicinamibacterales bacterium]|nr:GNVR domain-containing protein [Vicinamibacterales bacterium]